MITNFQPIELELICRALVTHSLFSIKEGKKDEANMSTDIATRIYQEYLIK